jgi:hypothetical protein
MGRTTVSVGRRRAVIVVGKSDVFVIVAGKIAIQKFKDRDSEEELHVLTILKTSK